MSDKNKVKEIMKSLGADLCGIASIDRFANAPEGYHPLDVFPLCKSVISFGEDETTHTWRIACHKCRDICPYNLGSENRYPKTN